MPAVDLSHRLVEAAHLLHPRLADASHKLVRDALPTLHRRQNQVTYQVGQESMNIIPYQYAGLNSGPAAGTVVGIVLGSVAGFLIIFWLLATTFGMGGSNKIAGQEEVVDRRHTSRSRSPPRSRRSRRSTRITETREVSRSPQTYVRRSSVTRARTPSRTVEERTSRTDRRVEGDDIVEVFEEHSDVSARPPRRKSSRRSGGGGGYR